MNSQDIRESAGITTNWQYREYLQKYGTQIMRVDAHEYFRASGNTPYYHSTPVPGPQTENQQMVANPTPFLYAHMFDTRRAPMDNTIASGDSDLKRDYLKGQRIKSRMIAPVIPVNKKM